MMLNAISLISFGAAVVHVHWQGHGNCAFGQHQTLAMIGLDFEIIGNDAELLARHLENVVLIDAQR